VLLLLSEFHNLSSAEIRVLVTGEKNALNEMLQDLLSFMPLS